MAEFHEWLGLIGWTLLFSSLAIMLYDTLPMLIQIYELPFWYITAVKRTLPVLALMGFAFYILFWLAYREEQKEAKEE